MTFLPERASVALLCGLLAGVGTLHLVHPEPFADLVPERLGDPRVWIYASGVAELAGAALVASPRTRRFGGWWTAVLLAAVFPGNVKAALDGGMSGAPWPLDSPAAAWARLPFQVPLVLWALRHARGRTLRSEPPAPRAAQGVTPIQPAPVP